MYIHIKSRPFEQRVLYVVGRRAEKEASHAVLYEGLSATAFKLCPLAGVCSARGEVAGVKPFLSQW